MSGSTKIIFVFGGLELGGAENQGFFLADYLQKECGYEVKVLGLSGAPGRLSQLCSQAGISWKALSVLGERCRSHG